jgi:hypothetical protein
MSLRYLATVERLRQQLHSRHTFSFVKEFYFLFSLGESRNFQERKKEEKGDWLGRLFRSFSMANFSNNSNNNLHGYLKDYLKKNK